MSVKRGLTVSPQSSFLFSSAWSVRIDGVFHWMYSQKDCYNRAYSLTWSTSMLIYIIRTKESFYIRKEFNSVRVVLVHKHGCRFVVLEHQYGRYDVMWIRSNRSLVGEGDNGSPSASATRDLGTRLSSNLILNQLEHYAVVDPGSLVTSTRPAIVPIRRRNYLERETAKMALPKKEGILIDAQRNCVIYLIRPRR